MFLEGDHMYFTCVCQLICCPEIAVSLGNQFKLLQSIEHSLHNAALSRRLSPSQIHGFDVAVSPDCLRWITLRARSVARYLFPSCQAELLFPAKERGMGL